MPSTDTVRDRFQLSMHTYCYVIKLWYLQLIKRREIAYKPTIVAHPNSSGRVCVNYTATFLTELLRIHSYSYIDEVSMFSD